MPSCLSLSEHCAVTGDIDSLMVAMMYLDGLSSLGSYRLRVQHLPLQRPPPPQRSSLQQPRRPQTIPMIATGLCRAAHTEAMLLNFKGYMATSCATGCPAL